MKLLVEYTNKENNYTMNQDGIILPLEDYSTDSKTYYNLTEIEEIINKTNNKIYLKMNKNFMNSEIEELKKILIYIDKLDIDGIFFYDMAILQLKIELDLKVDLIWNQTHMVNNYATCNYYYSKGVKYALLGKEITLNEIIEIIQKSKIISMVEVVSRPSVAFSKRKLVSNYYKDLNKEERKEIKVLEGVSNKSFTFIEDNNGTSIFLDTITNGTNIIKDLYEAKCEFIIFREYGISCFKELVEDTMNYIKNNCSDNTYIDKYKKLGDSTNFFFKKTVYKVKKNG